MQDEREAGKTTVHPKEETNAINKGITGPFSVNVINKML